MDLDLFLRNYVMGKGVGRMSKTPSNYVFWVFVCFVFKEFETFAIIYFIPIFLRPVEGSKYLEIVWQIQYIIFHSV